MPCLSVTFFSTAPFFCTKTMRTSKTQLNCAWRLMKLSGDLGAKIWLEVATQLFVDILAASTFHIDRLLNWMLHWMVSTMNQLLRGMPFYQRFSAQRALS